jgi:DNA-binding NarL/FixJ family response regulator
MPGNGRRILLVEDDSLTASLLENSLVANGFSVVTAGNAAEALALVNGFDPDAALIDIALGDGPNGLDLAHILHRERPWVALLILTKQPDTRTNNLSGVALPPGCGYLRKELVRDADQLFESLERVFDNQLADVRHDTEHDRPLAVLTKAQVEILRLIALGFNNDSIAEQRGVTRSSIERSIIRIFRALEIETHRDLNPRMEAARRFMFASGIPERG